MAEIIRVKCVCGNVLRAKAEDRGKRGRCPKCHRLITIPSAPSSTKMEQDTIPVAEEQASRASPTEGSVPKCKYHPERDRVVACSGCGSFLCEECANTEAGITFCRDCLTDPAKANTPSARAAQQRLLRRKGIAAGDFSRRFKARGMRDTIHYALADLSEDGKLLYFAIGLVISFSTVSAFVLSLALIIEQVWIAYLWAAIATVVHVFLFAGFAGVAKDLLFELGFDVGRFLVHSIRGAKTSWPAVTVVIVPAFLAGPVLWGEPDNLLEAFIQGAILCGLLTAATPAIVSAAEDEDLIASLRPTFAYLGTQIFTVVWLNLLTGLVVVLWVYTMSKQIAESELFIRRPILFVFSDLLTGLVVPLAYIIWIISSTLLYLSTQVSRSEVHSKAPSTDLPGPRPRLTKISVVVVLAVAAALLAVFNLTVPRRKARDAVSKAIKLVQAPGPDPSGPITSRTGEAGPGTLVGPPGQGRHFAGERRIPPRQFTSAPPALRDPCAADRGGSWARSLSRDRRNRLSRRTA